MDVGPETHGFFAFQGDQPLKLLGRLYIYHIGKECYVFF